MENTLIESQPSATTSTFLKDCMSEALMRLLEDYPLEKIQVKQICDASGYHRASWFRSFRSKHEAVTYFMVRLWQRWAIDHGVQGHDEFVIDNAEAFFQYNYEVRDITRLLYRRGLMDDLAASFTYTLRDRHRDNPEQAYQTAIFAFSLYGILREWILRDFDQPPVEMARIIRDATARMT